MLNIHELLRFYFKLVFRGYEAFFECKVCLVTEKILFLFMLIVHCRVYFRRIL